MSDYFAVNGKVLPADQAVVSVLDLGFLRGVGAFETFRTYGGGHPHALAEHLRRIWSSAEAVGIAPFFAETTIRSLVADILRRSGHEEMRVNLVVTPGPHTTGVFGADEPTWVLIARDLHAPSEEQYQHGVACVTFAAERHLPTHKTTNYLVGRTGILIADRAKAHEALYVDARGLVTEGVTSNVVLVKGGEVLTPGGNCLPGITKAGIRPLAEDLGLVWHEAEVTREDCYRADEVWITSAVRELLPVTTIDGRSIADGRPGRWARTLRPLYHARCVSEARRDAGLH